jgi:hypothetical protein
LTVDGLLPGERQLVPLVVMAFGNVERADVAIIRDGLGCPLIWCLTALRRRRSVTGKVCLPLAPC